MQSQIAQRIPVQTRTRPQKAKKLKEGKVSTVKEATRGLRIIIRGSSWMAGQILWPTLIQVLRTSAGTVDPEELTMGINLAIMKRRLKHLALSTSPKISRLATLGRIVISCKSSIVRLSRIIQEAMVEHT